MSQGSRTITIKVTAWKRNNCTNWSAPSIHLHSKHSWWGEFSVHIRMLSRLPWATGRRHVPAMNILYVGQIQGAWHVSDQDTLRVNQSGTSLSAEHFIPGGERHPIIAKNVHGAMRRRYHLCEEIKCNLCPLLDMILRVGERICQAEETVGMKWENDKNASRHRSPATEGGWLCLGKASEDAQVGPDTLAKGICVLFKMQQRITIACMGWRDARLESESLSDGPAEGWHATPAVAQCITVGRRKGLQCSDTQDGP